MIPLEQLRVGVASYWGEMASRSTDERDRDRRFPNLAVRFAWRQPARFVRSDLDNIIRWKYADARRRDAALRGLAQVADTTIEQATSTIAVVDDPAAAVMLLRGLIRGVGPAGISAILAAARPDLFPVVDIFALAAIEAISNPPWIATLQRDERGRPQADYASYPVFVVFCREQADAASRVDSLQWIPRDIDMALWGIGKTMADSTA